jgi:hypothetical protein
MAWGDLWHGLGGLCSPGPSIRAIEAEIREDFGVSHAFLVSSGTAALAIALMALRDRASSGRHLQRNEVIIPAYTCFSVPAAVVKAGLRPVLCDVDPSTFDFDRDELERTLNDRTLCVVAHHLFGFPAAMGALRRLCGANGTFLIEDAAQAMGAECDGRRLGTLGDVGIFSLGRGKNITCGAGGIVATSSGALAEAIAVHYDRLKTPSLAAQALDFARIVLLAIFVRPWLYCSRGSAVPRTGTHHVSDAHQAAATVRVACRPALELASRLAASNRGRAETAAYFARRLPPRFARDGSLPWLRLPIVAPSGSARARVYQTPRKRTGSEPRVSDSGQRDSRNQSVSPASGFLPLERCRSGS